MNKSNWQGKNGPLLIAEIGGNHEGDFNYAKKLVKQTRNNYDIDLNFDFPNWLENNSTSIEKYQSKDIHQWFQSQISIKRDHKILDVGCGTGKQSIYFQKSF